jgi:NIMA (never in mitosis gene a)-related kinase
MKWPVGYQSRSTKNILAKHGYTELKKIGEGTYGQALLVERDRDKLQFICKIVNLKNSSEKEKENAVKECRLLSSLRHPYIVRYRESFLEEKSLCIVMEYCEGGDLDQYISQVRKQGGSIPEDQVLRWLTQAVLALKHMHDKHILHRDLKSSNFFLGKNKTLRVGDFGIAKELASTVALAKTQIGTPYYLSPELCQGKPYSYASDIWSLGCVLYELCTLRVPFDAKNLAGLVDKICDCPAPEIPNSYSKELRHVCTMMLHRNPDQRPSANDLIQLPILQGIVRKLLTEAQAEDAPSDRASSRRRSKSPTAGSRGQSKSPTAGTKSPEEHSEASSSHRRRRSEDISRAPYQDSAGMYRSRDWVEYWSETHRKWLLTQVTDTDAEGRICIELKPNTWLTKDVQASRVRPGRNQAHSCDVPRCNRPESMGCPSLRLREHTPVRLPVAPPPLKIPSSRGPRSERSARVASPALHGRGKMKDDALVAEVHLQPLPKGPAREILERMVCRNAGMAIINQ